MPAAGGVPRRLTDDPAHDSLPRFTHDGAACSSPPTARGNWQIWEVPAEGARRAACARTPHTEWQVDQSPDGRQARVPLQPGAARDLFVLDLASGGAARVLARHGQAPSWATPTGAPTAAASSFSSNWRIGHQIYVVDAATGEETRLSRVQRGRLRAALAPGRRSASST